MGLDPLRQVRTGQKLNIPAKAWNELMKLLRESGMTDTGPGPLRATEPRGDVVLVKNNSGATRDRFEVLAVGAPIITAAANLSEFKQRPTFVGAAVGGSDTGRFVVLQEPLTSGRFGRAIISGLTIAKLNVISTSDKWADVESGDTTLRSRATDGAAQILWQEAGTGTGKLALVRIGLPPDIRLLPVTVAKDGDGGNGTSGHGSGTLPPDATYTVTDKYSRQLGTAMVPVWNRPPSGYHNYATHGTAYRAADGTWVLWQVDEVPGVC